MDWNGARSARSVSCEWRASETQAVSTEFTRYRLLIFRGQYRHEEVPTRSGRAPVLKLRIAVQVATLKR